jgi:ABC-type tungstate transport system substrate-binding protein
MLFLPGGFADFYPRACLSRRTAMSLGTILIILVILYLLGGWSGRIGGYGYGYGHSGMGLGGVVLVVLIVLLLLGRL